MIFFTTRNAFFLQVWDLGQGIPKVLNITGGPDCCHDVTAVSRPEDNEFLLQIISKFLFCRNFITRTQRRVNNSLSTEQWTAMTSHLAEVWPTCYIQYALGNTH